MSVTKCYFCNRRLKGGEWNLKVIDGEVRKICKNKRTCKLHQDMKAVKSGDDDNDNEAGAPVYKIVFDWQCCAVIIAGLITAITIGIALAIMAVMICS